MSICQQCQQPQCSCPPLPCLDCVEPETIVVKKVNGDQCEDLEDYIEQLVNEGRPECTLGFGTAIVSQKTVTLVALNAHGPLQYSADGVLWQDGATFINQANGTRRYYIRETGDTSCIAYGNVTVFVACVPNTNWVDVSPIQVECIDDFINVRQKDDCGNLRWNPTSTPCDDCVPTWVDVSPEVTQCVSGFTQIKIQDGCGNFSWRTTDVGCGGCTLPTTTAGFTNVPATCGTGGAINNNAQVQITGILNADRYAYAPFDNPTFLAYENSYNVPNNNIILLTGLPGSNVTKQYVIRLYNHSNSCYADKIVQTAAVNCEFVCSTPAYTLSKVDPTALGSAGASNNNGQLLISTFTNANKYQVCPDSSFTCTPNYDSAIAIVGSGPIVVKNDIGFFFDQPYRDFTVRVFGGASTCYLDKTLRFYNPYFITPGCTPPSYTAAVPTPATCSGEIQNNNASIQITGVTNATKYSFSAGTVYSGPAYSGATTIPGSTINLTGLVGSPNDIDYVIRLFRNENTCYVDIAVEVPGVDCEPDTCCSLIVDNVVMINVP